MIAEQGALIWSPVLPVTWSYSTYGAVVTMLIPVEELEPFKGEVIV